MFRMHRKKLLHRALSYRITGLCFRAHNELGRFARERQYADKLEELLESEHIRYSREAEISRTINGGSPDGNRTDFIIDETIIIELKAKKYITKEDYYQTQRYLHAAGLELGLIVNFRDVYLKPKRVLNTKLYQENSEHSDTHS